MEHDEPHYKSIIFNKQSENQKETKTRQGVSHMPEQWQLQNLFPFLPNAHPFFDRNSRPLPLRDWRKTKATMYALKKKTRLSSFSFKLDFFHLCQTLAFRNSQKPKKRKPKLQPLFFCRNLPTFCTNFSWSFIANVWSLLKSLM